MHGSLIDSHHRSSLSSTGPGALSSSEHTLTDDEHSAKFSTTNSHPMNSSTLINSKRSITCLGNVLEDDDDDKDVTTSTDQSADFFRWTHGHRHVMLTFCTICLFAFMTGVEYAVILPTAFDYVKTMTKENIYVGLILSAYSISGSIAGIIMGKISDMTGRVKILILAATIFEIGGNILYFAGKNIHIVLLGRFIAGVGMGAVPPILADVAHRTTENERTKAISIILGCRQLGLLIGPCFTILIRLMNFYIGSVHVYKLNGPGFLMSVVWLILQLVCWLCFYDRTSSKSRTKTDPNNDIEDIKQQISFQTYRDQYIRIEMFVLFLATFITYFNQTALETIVAGFTEKQFQWTTIHVSILFAFAGLEIIVVYVSLVKFFSKQFEDRILLIFGLLSLSCACIIGTFFTWASYSFGWSGITSSGIIDKRFLFMFIIFVILDLLGLPFIAATSVSLFTKLTIKELQGFSQGVQRFIMGIGTIIGPLFASSLLNHLHIMMTTMLALICLTLIAILIAIKRLRPLNKENPSNDKNLRHNEIKSSIEDQKLLTSTNSTKNCYVTLIQQEDEQNECLVNSTTNQQPNTSNLFSISNDQIRSLNNHQK